MATAVESDHELELDPATFELEIKQLRDSGFAASWTYPSLDDPERLDARMVPTGQPGVFAVQAPERSLFERMFASAASSNPLDRQTLLWARMGDDALFLYSLSIAANGQPTLIRSRYQPLEDGLALEREVRLGADPPIVIRARMARGGG